MTEQDIRREALALLSSPRLCPDCGKPSPIFYEGSDGRLRCPGCREEFLFVERVRERGGLTG